jgi:hypothetical protein
MAEAVHLFQLKAAGRADQSPPRFLSESVSYQLREATLFVNPTERVLLRAAE